MRNKFRRRLAEAESFGEIFSLVKRAVEETLGLRRAGLELALMELPNMVGGVHQVGTNTIILNKTIIEALARLVKSRLELNSYIFMVLLHEYIHSLGFLEEEEVREIVRKVIRSILGEDHPAYEMALKPIFELYPELSSLGPGSIGDKAEIVKDFDREGIHYIG